MDLHGDIVATLPISDSDTSASWANLAFTSFDEFGVAQPMTGSGATTGPPARYGWLGASQRSAEALGGVILMGARLYLPSTGRFLQIDPVAGGSASAYDYCNANPVNCTDLDGNWSWKGVLKAVAVVSDVASMVPGPIGVAAGLVAAGAYYATGDKKQALISAASAAASLVGAGGLVKAVNAASKVVKPAVKAGRAVVIGRDMARVGSAAAHLGAETYAPWAGWARVAGPELKHGAGALSTLVHKARNSIANNISYLHNMNWIRSVKRSGAVVYDIGQNAARLDRSRFYEMELRNMVGYASRRHVYWPSR